MNRKVIIDGKPRVLRPDTLYCVASKHDQTSYAWSPDGVGCYWYDTLEEATDQHGDQPVTYVDEITDF